MNVAGSLHAFRRVPDSTDPSCSPFKFAGTLGEWLSVSSGGAELLIRLVPDDLTVEVQDQILGEPMPTHFHYPLAAPDPEPDASVSEEADASTVDVPDAAQDAVVDAGTATPPRQLDSVRPVFDQVRLRYGKGVAVVPGHGIVLGAVMFLRPHEASGWTPPALVTSWTQAGRPAEWIRITPTTEGTTDTTTDILFFNLGHGQVPDLSGGWPTTWPSGWPHVSAIGGFGGATFALAGDGTVGGVQGYYLGLGTGLMNSSQPLIKVYSTGEVSIAAEVEPAGYAGKMVFTMRLPDGESIVGLWVPGATSATPLAKQLYGLDELELPTSGEYDSSLLTFRVQPVTGSAVEPGHARLIIDLP
jgi:hypothetical protein